MSLSGTTTLSVEEQKNYVLRDAKLVMQLSKHNNSEILDAMKSNSEITGLDFDYVHGGQLFLIIWHIMENVNCMQLIHLRYLNTNHQRYNMLEELYFNQKMGFINVTVIILM
jgi:hypothetical protein